KAQGLSVFPTEGEAVRALGQFLSHAELRAASRKRIAAVPGLGPSGDAEGVMLDEAASLALLQAHGVPVVAHRVCGSEADAVEAFDAFGGEAVVVKGCSSGVVHKSELGLVKIGLRDRESVASAWHDIEVAAKGADVCLESMIVAKLARGQRELMIGGRLDPVFGAVLLVGDGGKYVEAMPDSQVLLAPFDRTSIESALRRLRIAPLLDGVRGDPPLDVDAFCAAANRVGELLLDQDAGVTNLDINPVIVGAPGEGCLAVDAVVYRSVAERPAIPAGKTQERTHG
ncbi:MAG: acetate--CoA ligase family protein, partial [Gammaproteobacteria bacterium]